MTIPRIKVEVTSKHIKKGVRLDASSCPIALALRGLKLRNVEVGGSDVDYRKGGKSYKAPLPKKALKFIDKFDKGETVKPFGLTLAPYEVDEYGEKVDQRTKKSKTKSKKSTAEDTGC